MLGAVGDDAFGSELAGNLKGFRVDISRLETIPGPSGMAFITVDTRGQNAIIVSPGANGKLTPEKVPQELVQQAAMVVMQLEIPLKTVTHVAQLAHDAGVSVLLNPAPAQPLGDTLLAQLSVLVVNEGEAELLSGLESHNRASARQAAEALRARGASTVIVTLGENGLVWVREGSSGHLEAHAVEAVDTTAAGDAFCGALAAKLAAGSELEPALRFANAAGALAVTKKGAQPSLPEREAIEALLQR